MKHPNLNEEKKLWKAGYIYVVGLDEAGRGPLAGPVVASAVMIKNSLRFDFKQFKGIKDSKKLSVLKREEFYKIITKHSDLEWGRGIVSEKIIDKINIFGATKLAMKKALKNMKKKSDFLLLDGNFRIDFPLPQKPIIKGDEKVLSCALASVIAKVTRDRIMGRYHKKHPVYGFDRHKGYPTKLHYRMIKKHGPCPIHRKSFNLGLAN